MDFNALVVVASVVGRTINKKKIILFCGFNVNL